MIGKKSACFNWLIGNLCRLIDVRKREKSGIKMLNKISSISSYAVFGRSWHQIKKKQKKNKQTWVRNQP
jgi:hypothetical protein